MKIYDICRSTGFSQSQQNKKSMSHTMNVLILRTDVVLTTPNNLKIIITIQLPRRHCTFFFVIVEMMSLKTEFNRFS